MCFAITLLSQSDMVFIMQEFLKSFNLTFDDEWKTFVNLDDNEELVSNDMVNIVVLHCLQCKTINLAFSAIVC